MVIALSDTRIISGLLLELPPNRDLRSHRNLHRMTNPRAKPHRVIIWGPGGLGQAALYEALRSKDFRVVGVRAFSPDNEGKDAGEMIGEQPIGVAMTCDPKRALSIECDCVIHTPRDYGNYNNDAEILDILRSGRNIVTALPYHHVRLVRDPRFVAQLQQACLEGDATFHATGVDPDVISDRVLVALTGFCNDIEYLKLQENWDFFYTPPETLALCGFGKTPQQAQQMPVAAVIVENFLKQVCLGMGEALGVRYARVQTEHEYS